MVNYVAYVALGDRSSPGRLGCLVAARVHRKLKLSSRPLFFQMSVNREIRGNTLKVYLYLLKHGPSELRDVQRGVGLSSASLASYHLTRLSESGFVGQDEFGKYFAIKSSSDKVLDGYSKVGSAVVPQLFFFSLLFSILVVFFSVETLFSSGFAPYLIAVSVGMIVVFWFETVRLWRRLSV